MFAKIAIQMLTVSALAIGVLSTPVAYRGNSALVSRTSSGSSPSFNNWGGIPSMSNFDNFYGSGNFDGSSNSQIIIEQKQEVVCHTQQIEIIQQRLVVLQEMAKRIITEQICEVETQTFVFEQFHSSMAGFSQDLMRGSSRQVGYDSQVSGHLGNIMNSDGSLSTNDLGFSGPSVGNNTVVVGGSNWNNQSSPASVSAAFNATQSASASLHPTR